MRPSNSEIHEMLLIRQPRLSFGLLRGFAAVAQNLSFTQAAKDLCLTQSAVSRQIQTLEIQLGTLLFHRTRKTLELTAAGHALFSAVTSASQLIDSAVVRLNENKPRIELSIASCGSFASYWLVPRLSRFMASCPGYDVRIEAISEAAPAVPSGVDVAIRYFKAGDAAVGWTKLVDDELLPVCAPSLLQDAHRPLLQPSDLARHVQIQFTSRASSHRANDWARWREQLRLAPQKPAGTWSFSSYEHVLKAVLDGHGVALGRLPLVSACLRDGSLRAPLSDARVLAGAWHVAAADRQAHASEFLDWLIRESEQEPAWGHDKTE